VTNDSSNRREEWKCSACGVELDSAWECAVHILVYHGDVILDGIHAATMRRAKFLAVKALGDQVREKTTSHDRV
jgi:hypothetical protein